MKLTPNIKKEMEDFTLPLKEKYPWLGILIYDTSIIKTKDDLLRHIIDTCDMELKKK